MTNIPSCAHLSISWRTKDVPWEGPIIQGRGENAPLKPGMMVTQGWWGCDSCDVQFIPAAQVDFKTEKLRQALAEFGTHKQWCWARSDKGCSCGLAQLRAGVSP